MTQNVGASDRVIRLIAGFFLVLIGAAKSNLVLLLGVALLATGYLRTCPVYRILNINTNKSQSA